MSIKRLQDDNLTLRTINQNSVVMTESLSITDDGFHERILFLDPAGFTRTIVPLGTFRAGYTVVIFNQASSNNIIFDPNSLAYTIRQSSVYGPGSFTYNGSSWECRSPSRVFLSEFSGTLDDIDDGTTWGRIRLTYIDAGKITLALAEGDIDDIQNGAVWSSVLATELTAGMLKLSGHSVTELQDVGSLATQSSIGLLNYISNGDFVMFNASATVPDNWAFTGPGGSSGRTTAQKKYGTYSVVLTSGSGSTYIYQYLHYQYGINYFHGKTVSLAIWAWSSEPGRVRVWVGHDGYGGDNHFSGYHSGNSTWEQLTVIGEIIPSDATMVFVGCYIDPGTTMSAYFDGAMCVDGTVLPSHWVPRGVASPTGSGAIITANYMALMVSSVPRFLVTSAGSMWLQTPSLNYGFYYFGTPTVVDGKTYGEGDLRIGSVTDYILWDQSAGKFSIKTTGSILIESAGAFTVASGGGLVVTGYGDHTSVAPIIFEGTQHSARVSLSAAGDYLYVAPMTDNHQALYFGIYQGGVNYRWNSVTIEAANQVRINGGDNARVNVKSAGFIETLGTLLPDYVYTDDVGTSSFHHRNIYALNALIVGDLMVMDDLNDLDALMNIKAKVDEYGKEVLHPLTKIPLVDDNTLPTYILGINPEDTERVELRDDDLTNPKGGPVRRVLLPKKAGEISRKDDGRPFFDTTSTISWLMGCIKQLNIKVEDLIKKVGEIKPIEDIKP